jgi:hypothetical protein
VVFPRLFGSKLKEGELPRPSYAKASAGHPPPTQSFGGIKVKKVVQEQEMYNLPEMDPPNLHNPT